MHDRRAAAGLLALGLLLPATAYAAAATRVVRVSPLTASGQLRAGLRVTRTARGTCLPSSEAVTGAYRCFGDDNLIRDPCWRTGARTVICMATPWTHRVTRMHVRGGLTTPAGGRSRPWGLRLRNGQRCLRLQGASSVVGGRRVNYGCTRTIVLVGEPDRRLRAWRIRRARLVGDHFVAAGKATVATAYRGRA